MKEYMILKKLKSLVILLIILILFPYNSFADVFKAEFVKNYDGDTITVNIKDPPGLPEVFSKNISIRIGGIDTAEIRGTKGRVKELAKAAKDVVFELCNGKEISIVNPQREKYFRILGEHVFCADVNIGTFLLEHNLAIPYDGGTKPDWSKILNER